MRNMESLTTIQTKPAVDVEEVTVSEDKSVDITKTKLSCKRTDYLGWDEYFMAVAFLSAQRSKDPRTQVGACIVNEEKKIVGIGYNGMPIGCSDDLMPWNQHNKSGSKEDWLDSKKPYVCHAELNAVLNKNLANIKGCVIYVALFPCNTCAQIIIQSRISEVIYYSDKYHDREEFVASRRMFDMAKVKYRQFRPQKKITIDFELIEKTPGDVPPPLDKSHGTADVNENRHNGSDGNKITSNTSHSDELLQSADSDLPQPGGFHAEASGDSAAETEAHKATCV